MCMVWEKEMSYLLSLSKMDDGMRSPFQHTSNTIPAIIPLYISNSESPYTFAPFPYYSGQKRNFPPWKRQNNFFLSMWDTSFSHHRIMVGIDWSQKFWIFIILGKFRTCFRAESFFFWALYYHIKFYTAQKAKSCALSLFKTQLIITGTLVLNIVLTLQRKTMKLLFKHYSGTLLWQWQNAHLNFGNG